MDKIKGLIIKDLLQLKSYKKTLIYFIFIFTATGMLQSTAEGMSMMITLMLTLGLGMTSIATFNYDELAKAEKYILSLPTTKKEMLISRYIIIILITILGAILGTVISFIVVYIFKHQLLDVFEALGFAIFAIFAIGIVQSMQIPLIYKHGAEKGRVQVFIGMAILVILFGGIFFLINSFNVDISVLNNYIIYLPIVLTILTAAIYYLSYRKSYKIYSKKEV